MTGMGCPANHEGIPRVPTSAGGVPGATSYRTAVSDEQRATHLESAVPSTKAPPF